MNLLMVAVAGFCLAKPYCSAQEPKESDNRDAHGEILCMAITEDGQTLALGYLGQDHALERGYREGTPHPQKGHDREVRCVAFSPDAKVLASGSRGMTIKFWDAAT